MGAVAASASPHLSAYKMLVPDVLMDRLICSKCKNLLSVCPIHSLPDGGAICGRCIESNKPEGIRNSLYETLLECLKFPCMNKQFGCVETCTGVNMFQHEIKCPHRRINCPTFGSKGCEWIGEIDNLLEHFETNHATCLLKEPSFEVNFVHNYEDISLLPYADSLFLVKRHGDIEVKMFWCSIQTIFTNEYEKYEYFLTLKNPSNGVTIELPRKLAVSLNDEDGVEVEVDKIQKDLQNPSTIVATIDIIEPIVASEHKPKKDSDYLSESNLEMLRIIECPVCFYYMVPPIYQCSGGHSICGECKSKVQQCPTCEKSFGDTQNYAVESFTSFLKYPCKNLERGCEFLSSAKEIRQHEIMCSFGSFKCPISAYNFCNWSGLRQNMWTHCKEDHSDNVVECPFISIPFLELDQEQDDEDCFILKSFKNIFILHWCYKEERRMFFWSLQLVGPVEHSKDFAFDLDIIDRSGRNLRIYMRSNCESFSDKSLAFQEDKSFLFLTFDQVKSLINEVFCFKVSICRNQSLD